MNKEESIKRLKEIDIRDALQEDYDALEMAIQALSQEPTDAVSRILNRMWNCRGKHTTSIDKVAMEQIIRDELTSVTPKSIVCDDAISRKDVINAIDRWISEYKPQHYLIQSIRDLPSVTQKSGKWIRVTDKTGHLVWECDKCGWQQRLSNNFCPDCGAKMVEPQESEE